MPQARSVRASTDPSYARLHRLAVDAYALQYPDGYCRLAKSLASHPTGVRVVMEWEHEVSRINDAGQRRSRAHRGAQAYEGSSYPDGRSGIRRDGRALSSDRGATKATRARRAWYASPPTRRRIRTAAASSGAPGSA